MKSPLLLFIAGIDSDTIVSLYAFDYVLRTPLMVTGYNVYGKYLFVGGIIVDTLICAENTIKKLYILTNPILRVIPIVGRRLAAPATLCLLL